MRLFFLFLFAVLFQRTGICATVDTIDTRSQAMNKIIRAVIIRPDSYKQGKPLPVLYLLHGYSGNYADWITKAPAIAQLADQWNMMVVCPDGGFGSWYFDSPVDPSFRYETYICKELVPFIDGKFTTIANAKGRAITGLSMGGHGALYLGFRHQDIFGAAGSMSGGVDIRPFPLNWDLSKRLGAYAEKPENWEKNSVVNLLYLLKPGGLSLIIDCGTGDFFYGVNESLHRQLLERNIPHDYITRPGVHDWNYWSNAIRYQALFFHNFFAKAT